MKIITFASAKGGVGKTTTAALTAAELAENHRVAVVDFDANNNMTDFFLRNVNPEEITNKNVYHVLKGEITAENCIYSSDIAPLDIIPAAPLLSKITGEANGDPGIILRFASRIKRLDYDYIIIDAPPSLGLELRTALYSSELVFVPVSYNRWIIQGFDLVVDEVEKVREAIGRAPIIKAIPTMVTELEDKNLRDVLPDLPYTQCFVPRNAAIKNAGTNASLPRNSSIGALVFSEFAQEVQSL